MINIDVLNTELVNRRVAVFNSLEQSWRLIPVALTPTVVSKVEWQELAADARQILNVFPKLYRWLNRPAQSQLKGKILQGLSPTEFRLLEGVAENFWGQATIRLDLFWQESFIHIIEVNCTIPAMQAYSDHVFYAWKSAGGQVQGAESYRSQNIEELLRSLLAIYRRDGGMLAKPGIVILHREGDSQLGELLAFQSAWTALGYQTVLATPDQLRRAGDIWMVDGRPYDLIYRHIFAWRLEDPDLLDSLKNNRQFHIYNPVGAQFESKSFLALVSQIANDPQWSDAVGFCQKEINAIRKRVPWSRILGCPEISRDFSGSSLADTHDIDSLESLLHDFVIKRSVGYGGHQVIMGNEWNYAHIQRSLQELLGASSPVTFKMFARWVETKDSSLWIAQKRLSGAKRSTEVLVNGALRVWDAWYDASIFVNTRAPLICGGGVSRVAQTSIVNIGTGGGLAPFVITE